MELTKPPKDANNVEILIGLDYYFSIVTGRTLRGPPGNPVAVESILGWMICGRSNIYSNSSEVVTNLVCTGNVDLNEGEDLKGVLVKFWEVDTLSGDLNDIVQEQFDKNIYFNGVRYVTSLPFKTDVKFVPDNHQISYQRLSGLLNKLRKNAEVMKQYQEIIDSYEKDGIIEKVFDNGSP